MTNYYPTLTEMAQEAELIEVWRLFKRVKYESSYVVPELRLFEDESGGVLDLKDGYIIEWSNLSEAIERLEQFLSKQ